MTQNMSARMTENHESDDSTSTIDHIVTADAPASESQEVASIAAQPLVKPPQIPELIGVGSPLVDLILPVTDDFMATHVTGEKGGMVMVDAEVIQQLLAANDRQATQSPGGAAANTTVGCAHLGIRTAFIGACGEDEYADFYHQALIAQGCEPRLVRMANQPSGRVLSLVTPDAERTMRTCLGAAATLDPAHFTAQTFAGVRIVMLEGYTLFNHDLTRAIAKAAKDAGCELALDLASFEVVRANVAVINELLEGQVDLVFANEDEAKAWNDGTPEQALAELAERVKTVAVKLGKEGALIARGKERVRVSADVVQAIDTTGAGDCWAAGFIAGYLRGLPLDQCGRLGSLSGAAVVQVMGGQLPREKWLGIKGYLDAWA
jgi:sugar/nucleoside kinase (ribokinase family)